MIADDAAHMLGELVCAVPGGEIHGDRVGATSQGADVLDDGLGFGRAATVVHQDPSTGPGEGERAGATDTARGPGDEGDLSRETGHGVISSFISC